MKRYSFDQIRKFKKGSKYPGSIKFLNQYYKGTIEVLDNNSTRLKLKLINSNINNNGIVFLTWNKNVFARYELELYNPIFKTKYQIMNE